MSSAANGITTAAVLPQPKQIRFVNNEGQPPAKRRRITAACRTCRKRKTRCDGLKPFCRTCTENGHQCLGYAEPVSHASTTRRHSDTNRSLQDDGGEDESASVSEGQISSPRILKSEQMGYDRSRGTRRASAPNSRAFGQSSRRNTKDEDYDTVSPVYADGGPSPVGRSALQAESHRVPYFRYFGPTAIVPGFKQMVVSVREHRRSTGAASASAMSPVSYAGGSIYGGRTPSQAGTDPKPSIEIPTYDQSDPLPVSPLIIHLANAFFIHLGCNYPFLRKEKFLRSVEDKRAEPILVDAVCALASRFSDHPNLPLGESKAHSDHGHVFAQRAKSAVVDTFPCPTVAAVQACLLLAYEGFGAGQDSALWMYLGCAIRMAVDLGLQKLDGLKARGQGYPGFLDAQNEISPVESISAHDSPEMRDGIKRTNSLVLQEKRELEQERIDTLWAVFVLDRVISSGTGRPVTLRDEDFELQFPETTSFAANGWPAPYPALIQVIHLYGRVSDSLNNIRDVKDVSQDKMDNLAARGRDVTNLYQKLDQRLIFNAANFQHYVKAGEGTTFLLIHFWFHTLIMLLHQPTLLHSFEGGIQQLLPHSRELSMSSAKTISDIIAFADVIDSKSFIGNPFTSQPMYIAACAFLMEIATHTSSQSSSRAPTPPRRPGSGGPSFEYSRANAGASKHTLLASAANQNYQRCYKALQQLEQHWAGARYILTALDQKAKGIWDPETFTQEEMEMTKLPRPSSGEMVPHGLRQKLSIAGFSPQLANSIIPPRAWGSPRFEVPASAMFDPGQAIGWSLTGTTNSPNSNLTFLYQSLAGEGPMPPGAGSVPARARAQAQAPSGTMIYDPIRQSLPEASRNTLSTSSSATAGLAPGFPHSHERYTPRPGSGMRGSGNGGGGGGHGLLHPPPPPPPKYQPLSKDPATTSEAEMLLGLQNTPPYAGTPASSHNSYETAPAAQSMPSPSAKQQDAGGGGGGHSAHYDFSSNNGNNSNGNARHASHHGSSSAAVMSSSYSPGGGGGGANGAGWGMGGGNNSGNGGNGGNGGSGNGFGNITDMMMESQDIDMSMLSGEMVPWLEYLPTDIMNIFDSGGQLGGGGGGGGRGRD